MLVRLLVIVLIALPRFPGYLSPSAISCVAAKGVSGMAKRRANGEGKLRKRDGRWEGRYTTEHAPGTDKAIYRDVLGRIPEENKVELKQVIEQEKTYSERVNGCLVRELCPR